MPGECPVDSLGGVASGRAAKASDMDDSKPKQEPPPKPALLSTDASWSEIAASSASSPTKEEAISAPMTPSLVDVSRMGSSLDSSSSARCSITDLSWSHAALPVDDETRDPASPRVDDDGNLPQFIMPTVLIPNRRPFTDVGKSLGRLKILCAGGPGRLLFHIREMIGLLTPPGVGKTSLIKAVIQSCQHIVHADPGTPAQLELSRLGPSHPNGVGVHAPGSGGSQISEIYASTRPCPPWRLGPEEAVDQHRRRLADDMVLDRNICLVDSPGNNGRAVVSSQIGYHWASRLTI